MAADEPVHEEIRDGLRIEWDVPIEMDDGVVLRADVYRPPDRERSPVILSYGPYGKGLPFQVGYPDAWERLVTEHPEVAEGSTCQYQSWEVADPEKWVPHGYACVRVDARGWGRSPGVADPYGPRGTRDFYDCIEWAGTRPWSTGKVGLLGISYYAVTQWLVASLQPPHLAAMIPWEGASDCYRDRCYHGGILSEQPQVWFGRMTPKMQHGFGERGPANPVTGDLVCGPETLSDEELEANRIDYLGEIRRHPLEDEFHTARSADFDRIEVPLLSAGNWGGHGLHLRGNVEGFVRAASRDKWLEIHGREHWTEFYTDYGLDLQRRFFDHYLQGIDNGWCDQPPVLLRVRTVDGFVDRAEYEWPLERTHWARWYLDADTSSLADQPVTRSSSVSYRADGDGVTFLAPAVQEPTEITGPVAARLSVATSATDGDLFVVLRVFDPRGEEVVFQSAVDPHSPIALGWLRLSHRELAPELGTHYRPFHRHRRLAPVEPGEVYDVDVEIWPTSIVLPPGYQLGLTVRGKDYEYAGATSELTFFKGRTMKGTGVYTHGDERDRPEALATATTTLHTGGGHESYVQVPVVPPAAGA